MIRREDKEISNEHPLAKKAEVERIELASMKGPPVPIDIGKILLLKRLVREGKFKEIRKLKGGMGEYLSPKDKKGLKKR